MVPLAGSPFFYAGPPGAQKAAPENLCEALPSTTRSPQRESRCSLVFWQKHNLAPKGLVGGDAILGTQVMSWGGLDVGCGTLSHSRWKGATVKEWARVWDPSYSVEKRTKTKAALPFNGPG